MANKFVDSVFSQLNDSDPKGKARDVATDNVFLDRFRKGKSPDQVPTRVDMQSSPAGLIKKAQEPSEDSATIQLHSSPQAPTSDYSGPASRVPAVTDATQPMTRPLHGAPPGRQDVKQSFGAARPPSARMPASPAAQMTEAQLAQAENLKLAQSRISELENELENVRNENELLSSAGAIARQRIEELTEKLHALERVKVDVIEQSEMEQRILKDGAADKNRDLIRAKKRIEELESRLNSDVKKIRMRERELENRLELARMEKTTLIRSKDEAILDLKRRLDELVAELEGYKSRVSELQRKIDVHQEQSGKTVRALRLALATLENTDPSSGQLVPVKKAE